jgi:hypothetical protein
VAGDTEREKSGDDTAVVELADAGVVGIGTAVAIAAKVRTTRVKVALRIL